MLGPTERLVRDDEARVRRPRVDAEAALLAAARHELAIVNLEAKPEPGLHLALPLRGDGGGAEDENEVDALTEEQLLKDQPRLDGFPEADVVGDEEVSARELERLHERSELVVLEMNPGAKRRLKEATVGGGDGVPFERMHVRRERVW